MIRSMTGYGKAVKTTEWGTITVEISSVNRKHLDVKFLLSKELTSMEADLRTWLAPYLVRGYVTVKMNLVFTDQVTIGLLPNFALAKSYFKIRSDLEEALGIVSDRSTWGAWLLEQEGVVLKEDNLEDQAPLKESVQELLLEVLKPFHAMKEREGAALLLDLMERLHSLKTSIQSVEKHSPIVVTKYRQRLYHLLQELKVELDTNDEVILREVALLADRSDINEEIARFKSHIDQIEQLLNGKNQHIGKTAEFILQEMVREVNTIGSKANEMLISSEVIQMKSELERMREQIQNVE